MLYLHICSLVTKHNISPEIPFTTEQCSCKTSLSVCLILHTNSHSQKTHVFKSVLHTDVTQRHRRQNFSLELTDRLWIPLLWSSCCSPFSSCWTPPLYIQEMYLCIRSLYKPERRLRAAENISYNGSELTTQQNNLQDSRCSLPLKHSAICYLIFKDKARVATQETIDMHQTLWKVYCEFRVLIIINVCTCTS